jgi:hypothetical protein
LTIQELLSIYGLLLNMKSAPRGARAILDADRDLKNGRHLSALTRIFRRRKIGPLQTGYSALS